LKSLPKKYLQWNFFIKDDSSLTTGKTEMSGWNKNIYKEFANISLPSQCGRLCLLDDSSCQLFMVVNGSCLLGDIQLQNKTVTKEAMDEIILQDNSESTIC